MQLRWHGLQLLVLLIILMAFEGGSTAEPLGPCSPTSSGMPTGSPTNFDTAIFRSPTNVIPQECSAVIVGVNGLRVLVNKENAHLLGFTDLAEASSAQSGMPLNVYLVNLADLRNFDPAGSNVTCDPPSSKVTCLIKEIESRIYPLLTARPEDGGVAKTRSALVVSKRKGKNDNLVWTPTNWGLTLLAKDMTEYRASVNGFESGFILWIPALNLHFLGDKLTEDLMLVPLADRKAYGLTKGVKISAKIVFALYAREAKSLDEHSPG